MIIVTHIKTICMIFFLKKYFSEMIYTLCFILFFNVFFVNSQFFENLHNVRKYKTLTIIGGKEVFPHSLGYQVLIRIEEIEGYVSYCGGSLITPSFVLTAAHCLDSVYSLEVILGAHNISKKECTQVSIIPENYTVHPDWDSKRLINDIALIQLPSAVKINGIIRTIPLSEDVTLDYTGNEGMLSGWGMTKYNGPISDVLEYAKGTILSNEECKNIPPFNIVIQDTHMCLLGKGFSSCEGDSGGPLVVNGIQVGVVSFNLKHCDLGSPSAFTRISKYLEWIQMNSDLKLA